jgi:uncharacterized repeat protein (TIGR01451 family)
MYSMVRAFVLPHHSPRVIDSTTVLTAGRLLLTKTARNCGNMVGPSDPCSEVYATGVNGKPDDVIEYRIEYRNTGSSPISLITITDPVPEFTTALPYIVWTQPNGSSLTSPNAHIVLVTDPGLSVTFDLPGVVLSTSCLSLTALSSNLNRPTGVRTTYLTRNSEVLRFLAERKNAVGRYLGDVVLLQPGESGFVPYRVRVK